tara:strand:+ start:12660 stop:13301 length:642 start_codon:yes stop_codon:yes gene_type:complete
MNLKIPFPRRYPTPRPLLQPTQFEVLYADPPWDYDGRTFLNNKGNDTGAASDHYPTMKPQQLIDMGQGIKQITAENAICFMWTTGPQLDVSIEVLKAWGFKYKTVAFVWEKVRPNPGYYTMSSTEFVIVGTNNTIPKPRGRRNIRQFILKKRMRHSSKPHQIRTRIEKMFPSQTKLELFSRTAQDGWYVWGNQSPECVILPALSPYFGGHSNS